MSEHDWNLVGVYDMPVYECGLQAGQILALRRDLVVTNPKGPTGEIRRKGELHKVLHGSTLDPGVVWLLKPNGRRCTWVDGPEIFDWFEVVGEESVRDPESANTTPDNAGEC